MRPSEARSHVDSQDHSGCPAALHAGAVSDIWPVIGMFNVLIWVLFLISLANRRK
jgi:hypothetical protein